MSTRTLILPIGGGGLDPTDYYNKQEVDQLLSAKEDSADLATVAESGSYNDLINKPNYGASLSLTIDSSTFVMTAQLLDQNGNNLGSAQTVDLPLESVVVSGRYDDQTKKVILTLQNGSTIEFSIADLVSGLQTEITAQNPLSADLLTDGTTNKVFTATEQSKLAGLTVNDATITIQQDGTTVGTFTTNDANDTTINLTGGGGSDWYGTQAQFDALTEKPEGDYHISGKLDYNTDLKNTPDLGKYATKTEVQTADATLNSKIGGKMANPSFMTAQEFSQITPKEGENYFIQGETVAMTFTLQGGSTVTYNVVVD